MGRTGIEPGEPAAELYALVDRLPNLVADGLHAYDGQIHDSDREERRRSAQDGIERTLALRDRILKLGMAVPRLVMGGTPTFPIHAELDVPGCGMFARDHRAARPRLFLTISGPRLHAGRPAPDPGRQSSTSGTALPGPRSQGRGCRPVRPPGAVTGSRRRPAQSATARNTSSSRLPGPIASRSGPTMLAVPTHICPTVALHRRAYVIEDGELVGQWEVTARDRVLGI